MSRIGCISVLALATGLGLLAGRAGAGGGFPRSGPDLRPDNIALVGDEIQVVVRTSSYTRGPGFMGGPTGRDYDFHFYLVRYRLPREAGKAAEWVETHELLSPAGRPWGDRSYATYLIGFAADRVVRVQHPLEKRIDLYGPDAKTGRWKILASWEPTGQFFISQDGRYLIPDAARPTVLDLATLEEADAKSTPPELVLDSFGGKDDGDFHVYDRRTGRVRLLPRNNTPNDEKAYDLTDGRLVGGRPLFLGVSKFSFNIVPNVRGYRMAVLDSQGKALHETVVPAENWQWVCYRLAGDHLGGRAPPRAIPLTNLGQLSTAVQIWDYQTGAMKEVGLKLVDEFERSGRQFLPKKR